MVADKGKISNKGVSSLKRKKEHRLVYEMIKEADLTLELLDARFPHRCRSLFLEELVADLEKPLLLCLTKTDIVPKELPKKWKKILQKDYPVIYVSAHARNGTSMLRKAIFRNSPIKATENNPLTICVVGYPNVGKSSLINVLAGRRSAPVSPQAGFTRSIRRVKIAPKLYMIDTPGISPTAHLSTNEKILLGAISPEEIIDPDIALDYIFSQVKKYNLIFYWEAYLKTSLDRPIEEILEVFARKRGLLGKGGSIRTLDAARVILHDYMKGKITYYEIPDNL